MPLHIIRDDITKIKSDMIVNATNETLNGNSPLEQKAKPSLKDELKKIGYCETGKAVVTNSHGIDCEYLVHAVGPVWKGGNSNEEQLLKSTYLSCLKLASKYKVETIAFPLISSGNYQYPKDQAFQAATQTIQEYLLTHELTVYLVVYDKQMTDISKKVYADVREYIDDHYVIEHPRMQNAIIYEQVSMPIDIVVEESFLDALIRLIDEKKMTDSECYKKANIDRKLFNKIKNNPNYHPRKETVIAFAIALELDLYETNELLEKAGYVLSNSFVFDVIIKYFIENKIYDVLLINETLYAFDQKLLTK